MKNQRNRLLAFLAIGLVALGTGASRTVAQSGFRGSFTLPYEVRWNNTLLPAGDYTFRMESTSLPARMVLAGPKGTIMINALTVFDHKTNQHSALTVERRAGMRYVHELYLADYGRHISYWAPKLPSNEKLLAQAGSATEHISVSTGK
jgi:hypothetical protein